MGEHFEQCITREQHAERSSTDARRPDRVERAGVVLIREAAGESAVALSVKRLALTALIIPVARKGNVQREHRDHDTAECA